MRTATSRTPTTSADMMEAAIMRAGGHEGVVRISMGQDTIEIPVIITDARTVWGRTQAQVEPVGGKGRAWVGIEKIVKKGGI